MTPLRVYSKIYNIVKQYICIKINNGIGSGIDNHDGKMNKMTEVNSMHLYLNISIHIL